FTANLPAAGNVGSTKLVWAATDLAQAQTIDWIVQGSTYGRYNATVGTRGASLAACGWTDIDGDGVMAADGVFQPQINAAGGVTIAPPAAPCDPATDTNGLGLTYTHGTTPMGGVISISSDKVF
ncbi:MAG TPA: hypothetical protein VFE30_14665, partial [Anaeromyxobacteraceae bacterium]|nr:hypothetical protein [Anaeromyxobacteraceae bacterium]